MVGLQRVQLVSVVVLSRDPFESLVFCYRRDIAVAANRISSRRKPDKALGHIDQKFRKLDGIDHWHRLAQQRGLRFAPNMHSKVLCLGLCQARIN